VGKTETLQPLETLYQGVKFRSRLEARWAVFYDNIEMPWFYEPEGYKLKNGVCYLPDFYLPVLKSFVEIKGEKPMYRDGPAQQKCAMLSKQTHKTVYLFYGTLPFPSNELENDGSYQSYFNMGRGSAYVYRPNGKMDDIYAWCECPSCHMLSIQRGGLSERIPCGCHVVRKNAEWSPRLLKAYETARSERFGT
jgi:hypothetical protein